MAEYIDRDRLKKEFLDWFCNGTNDVCIFIDDILMFIDETEVEDVVPVKHGKWVRMDTDSEAISKCSVCKYPVSTFWNESTYCPNCGARMDL